MITSSREDLYFKGSNILPEIIFTKDGNLKILGRIIPENISIFFIPLKIWIENLRCNKVFFDINIEYMSPKATRELFHLLRILDEHPSVQHIVVLWHYDEEDEEYREMGKFLATRFENIRFICESYVK